MGKNAKQVSLCVASVVNVTWERRCRESLVAWGRGHWETSSSLSSPNTHATNGLRLAASPLPLKSFTLRGLQKEFAWECLNSPNEILSRQQQSLQLSLTLFSIPPSPPSSKPEQTPHRIVCFDRHHSVTIFSSRLDKL